MIEQTRFLSTVFLGSEFKLENIYSGVNFCEKNVCGNLLLCIAGKTAKIAKIRTRQKFLPHGSHNETQGTRENSGVTNSQNKLVNTLHKRYRNGSGKSSVSGTVSGIGSGNGIGIVISSVVIVVWIVVVVIVIVIVIAMTASFYSIAKACI